MSILYSCEYRLGDNLFDTVYGKIIVPEHVRRMFLNYMDFEWDNVQVNPQHKAGTKRHFCKEARMLVHVYYVQPGLYLNKKIYTINK